MPIFRPFLLIFLTFLSMPARAEIAHVTFVLVNDIYEMSAQIQPDGKPRGGFARLAAVVKAERAKGAHVIFAHAGDTLSPSLMSGFDRGEHIIALTNMISPDIFVPGNHEFDFGKATFERRMAEAKFPLFAANLRGPDGAPLAGFKDSEIFTIDGVRIGLTGETYDDAARASTPEDLRFAPTVATARDQAQALRRAGADFVVAVVHADRKQDYALMATHAIDLVLSGHDHDLFIEFDGRNAIVESSFDAHYVTVIDVTIEVKQHDGHRDVTWWPNFRIIDTATVTPDAAVTAAVAEYAKELTREMDVPLGTTAVALDSRGATLRTREDALGGLVADAMRVSMHADAAIMNGGGIRGDKVLPPGSTITRRDVLAALPFNNRIIPLEVSGRGLKSALENGIAQMPNAVGRFPQVSGLMIEADLDRPAGDRITSIKVDGVPLDEDRNYRIATNDFLARGGDGYDAFRDARHFLSDNDAPLLANAVMVYIRQLWTVRTSIDGRLVFK
jgi:2',3'-cyclic-nucleotide 2'-phosphodiesterase (5'-nucleotidase family)